MLRPDFSKYVVHFTKDGTPFGAEKHPAAVGDIASARERLFSILAQKKLRATPMPWTNKPASCFTECTWHSLLGHANVYSRYGIGFAKEFLFANGGGPAVYLAPELLELQKAHVPSGTTPFAGKLWSFVTPFAPGYAPQRYKDKFWSGRNPIDYSHEREWRMPADLTFPLELVSFVIVDTYEDMAVAPAEFKDKIGRDNWIIMSMYERIEQLWPVHQLP